MVDEPKIVINDAPSQIDRWLQALDAHYVDVDGRDFTELLSFALGFGKLINFYDAEDCIDGDWREFFACSPTMLLASILAVEVGDIDRRFQDLCGDAVAQRRIADKAPRLHAAFELVHRTARHADVWLKAARLQVDVAWAGAIRARIETGLSNGVAERLQHVAAGSTLSESQLGKDRAVGLSFAEFDPAWGLGDDDVATQVPFFEGKSVGRRADSAWPHLSYALQDLLILTGDLQRIARTYFSESLQAADHPPQIGLYMAFCRLFKEAQDTINTFSERYIDFYYHDVLRNEPQDAIGDKAYLTFELAGSEGVSSAPVPAGTLFPAGSNDEDQEILYAAETTLTVTAAEIDRIHTLRIDKAPLWFVTPEGTAKDEDVQAQHPHGHHHHGHHHHWHHHHHHWHHHHHHHRKRSETVLPALAVSSDILLPGEEIAGSDGWATFGVPLPQIGADETSGLAKFGFALSSQTLLLNGGQREIELIFGIAEGRSAETLEKRLHEIAEQTGVEKWEVLIAIVSGAFDIYVFTDEGWVQTDGYRGHGYEDYKWIEISVDLAPDFPAVRLPEDEGETDQEPQPSSGFRPNAPALMAELRQTPILIEAANRHKQSVCVYPYAVLAGLEIDWMALLVGVEELPMTAMRNTDGEIDPESPYAFFGGSPQVGSFFEIQDEELFVKQVDYLSVHVDWFELPQGSDGFAGYYRFYTIGLDGEALEPTIGNASFKVDVGVRNPGWWDIFDEENRRSYVSDFVYRTIDPKSGDCSDDEPAASGDLCPATDFSLYDAIKLIAADPYYSPADSALYFRLSAPPYGYGSTIYPQNVLKSVIGDLPDSSLCEVKCQADCAIWINLQSRIETALEVCADRKGSEYIVCVWPKLSIVILRLVGAYESCLARNGDLEPDDAEAEAVSVVRDTLKQDLGSLHANQQETIARLRGQLANDRDRLTPIRSECRKFLDIALEIWLATIEAAFLSRKLPVEEALPTLLEPVLERMGENNLSCLEICIAACMQSRKELEYPNDPYLPQAMSVAVEYWAYVTMPPDDDGYLRDLQFFHLLPFGGHDELDLALGPASWLPTFEDPGNLYLGLSPDFQAQDLTLLFRMANARGGGTAARQPPVTWSYLDRESWIEFPADQVDADGTDGLQQTGILALRLDASSPSDGVLPADARWLRATVPDDPAAFPDTISVTPHALLATRETAGENDAPYETPTPAGTITSSLQNLGDIAAINQPMDSFGGKPRQDERAFKIYSGERLRHKERAILAWDYERLLLERFPELWKVKALAAHDGKTSKAAGNVLVVVVPGPDYPQVSDPTVPTVAGDLLRQMRLFLSARASPFAAIRVDNPIYVRIKVEATVVFADRFEPGDMIERLNDDLVHYLSPWFYDAERASGDVRYWQEAEISTFIQTRPYVDALRTLKLHTEAPTDDTSADWCFMTSAKSHAITDANWKEAV